MLWASFLQMCTKARVTFAVLFSSATMCNNCLSPAEGTASQWQHSWEHLVTLTAHLLAPTFHCQTSEIVLCSSQTMGATHMIFTVLPIIFKNERGGPGHMTQLVRGWASGFSHQGPVSWKTVQLWGNDRRQNSGSNASSCTHRG